jgi:hypothetical protein
VKIREPSGLVRLRIRFSAQSYQDSLNLPKNTIKYRTVPARTSACSNSKGSEIGRRPIQIEFFSFSVRLGPTLLLMKAWATALTRRSSTPGVQFMSQRDIQKKMKAHLVIYERVDVPMFMNVSTRRICMKKVDCVGNELASKLIIWVGCSIKSDSVDKSPPEMAVTKKV